MIHISVFFLDWVNFSLTKSHIVNFKNSMTLLPKYHVMSEVVHWHQSLLREATASALSKGEVKGTGKKPFAQKGRGMARQGSLKNPHQRGGGVAFPPRNRIYKYKMNRKKRHLAFKSIFFFRVAENKIKVIENLNMVKASTKIVNKFFKKNLYKKILMVDNNNLYLRLSVNNISTSKYLNFKGLNTLDLLKYPKIILTKNILNKIMIQFDNS